MVFYDSSVLIDYLDGDDSAVTYIESHADERAVTIPLVSFEVYQGEVYKSGPADFDAVEDALDWVDVVDESPMLARDAAELLDFVAARGSPLAARDAYVAGAAEALEERLAVADADFDTDRTRGATGDRSPLSGPAGTATLRAVNRRYVRGPTSPWSDRNEQSRVQSP